ncbi:ribosome small subunit-dependent GTPase A [Aliiroseovarius sp. YM-037]|uniref:ribosome small subunit-dependent GTPase A n=1 Tax=Aliiroseovarius sp. YM-037 TaxID=3341728 RepID=UPI003A804790
MSHTLSDLGWSAHFMMQLSVEELETYTPARITSVHRAAVEALTESGPRTLVTPPDLPTSGIAVGDWVMIDDSALVIRLLDRLTTLSRRASGEDARQQLLAANVDTLFIVSSCNADFNPARLERYLVLAESAGCQPVIVLTKPDLCDDADRYVAQAETLAPALPVLALDARDKDQAARLFDWWRKGQTAALLGSSGVGKSTLTATLTGQALLTQDIREDDAKGRHTTTARNLYPATHGGWLVDTPGMRALRLHDASDGIDAVFADLTELAEGCKFRDCQHDTEPGCAIQAEIAAGRLDPARLRRWQKLEREDARNSETLAESRARNKALGKFYKRHQDEAKNRKGR